MADRGVKMKTFLIICIIVNASLIFYFSHQPATISASQSGVISGFIVDHMIPGNNEITAIEKEQIKIRVDETVRDIAHIAIYVPLGLCSILLAGKKRAWLVLLAIGMYAATDEVHQIWIDGRAAQVADWMKDMLGAGIGVLIGIVWKVKS